MVTFVALPADLAHPIPDSVSFEDGAMVEPLSVGVHAVSNLGQLRSNQNPRGLWCWTCWTHVHGRCQGFGIEAGDRGGCQ